MLYSKSTNSFYLPEVHGEGVPSDAVEISAERHLQLLMGERAGQKISPDIKGYPVLVDQEQVCPRSIEMRQVRRALLALGYSEAIGPSDLSPEARIDWEYETTVKRSSHLVEELQRVLGLSHQQMDDLFILGFTL